MIGTGGLSAYGRTRSRMSQSVSAPRSPRLSHPMVMPRDVHHTDLIYAIARGAGFSPERIVIQDLDEIVSETIKVAIP